MGFYWYFCALILVNVCYICYQVAKSFEKENDKVKFMVLKCADEDDKCVRAAAGALAILTADSEIVCNKIFQV